MHARQQAVDMWAGTPKKKCWLGSLLFTIAAAPLMAELIAPRLIPRVDHFDRNAATLQTLFSRLRPP
jgi:hypothetical protein